MEILNPMKKKQKNNLTWFDRILFAIINFLRPQPTPERIAQLMGKKETEEIKKMSNVYKLDGSTNIKMGTFCGKPALFIRPMFPKDPVNHSHEERHAWHMNDLAEDEQVILMDDGQDLGQLYMAMRQTSSHVRQLHRGEDMSVHVHTHPSTGESAVDKKFKDMVILPEMSWVSEPGIQVTRFGAKHGDERVSGVSTEIIDGLMHITETHVRVEDPNLGRGCSTSRMIIDPPPEVAEAIYEAQTGHPVTDEQRRVGEEAIRKLAYQTHVDTNYQEALDKQAEATRCKEIFSFDNKQQHSTVEERNDFSQPDRSEPSCSSSTSDNCSSSE